MNMQKYYKDSRVNCCGLFGRIRNKHQDDKFFEHTYI